MGKQRPNSKHNRLCCLSLLNIDNIHFWLMLPLVVIKCMTFVVELWPPKGDKVFCFFFPQHIKTMAVLYSDKELFLLLNDQIVIVSIYDGVELKLNWTQSVSARTAQRRQVQLMMSAVTVMLFVWPSNDRSRATQCVDTRHEQQHKQKLHR